MNSPKGTSMAVVRNYNLRSHRSRQQPPNTSLPIQPAHPTLSPITLDYSEGTTTLTESLVKLPEQAGITAASRTPIYSKRTERSVETSSALVHEEGLYLLHPQVPRLHPFFNHYVSPLSIGSCREYRDRAGCGSRGVSYSPDRSG